MKRKLNIIIEKDNSGYFAYVPELKGCQSEGATYQEALANINEAIELYLDTMTKVEIDKVFNKETTVTSLELEIA